MSEIQHLELEPNKVDHYKSTMKALRPVKKPMQGTGYNQRVKQNETVVGKALDADK